MQLANPEHRLSSLPIKNQAHRQPADPKCRGRRSEGSRHAYGGKDELEFGKAIKIRHLFDEYRYEHTHNGNQENLGM